MNRIVAIAALVLTGYSVSAQNSETRKLSSFDEVSVSQGIEVYLSEGSEEKARIEIDGNIDLDEVLTDVNGGTLKIHLDGNNYRNVDVQVYVTYKRLEGLRASSAGSIEVKDDVECDCSFDIDVSSAGEVEVTVKADEVELEASSAGDIDARVFANDLEASVSSAGDIEISGKVREIEVTASSSGDFSGYDLVSEEADLRASSGGSIKVTVTKDIKARASSGGSINYKGNPEYSDKESSSGGSVRRN